VLRRQGDAKPLQSRDAVRHQAFAACFIDRRLCAVRNRNFKPLLPRSDSCCQSRRPTTYYENICRLQQL